VDDGGDRLLAAEAVVQRLLLHLSEQRRARHGQQHGSDRKHTSDAFSHGVSFRMLYARQRSLDVITRWMYWPCSLHRSTLSSFHHGSIPFAALGGHRRLRNRVHSDRNHLRVLLAETNGTSSTSNAGALGRHEGGRFGQRVDAGH